MLATIGRANRKLAQTPGWGTGQLKLHGTRKVPRSSELSRVDLHIPRPGRNVPQHIDVYTLCENSGHDRRRRKEVAGRILE